jgi:hypothetical protein
LTEVRIVHNEPGGYRFLGGEGRPFSQGAVADPGLDLVHATFERPLPLGAGVNAAADHVSGAGRPVHAIAGFELRIPRPLSTAGFAEFNQGYIGLLTRIGLNAGGLLPAARTNVAPTTARVEEPSVFAFCFTVPSNRGRPAFVLAGVPEEVEGDQRAMLRNITGILVARGGQLGCRLEDATVMQIYADAALTPEAVGVVAEAAGGAAIHGLRWFPSQPPIEGLRYEIDARAAGSELFIS